MVSSTCATSHSLSFSSMERWNRRSVVPVEARAACQGVRRRARLVPPAGAAVPEVLSVARVLNRAVAIDAIDLDGGARFAVELAVAVAVLLEVAVDAVHALVEVDVLQVDGLLELVGIVEGDCLVVLVEQVALAVVLEDGAEDPAVAVVVGELRVLELAG